MEEAMDSGLVFPKLSKEKALAMKTQVSVLTPYEDNCQELAYELADRLQGELYFFTQLLNVATALDLRKLAVIRPDIILIIATNESTGFDIVVDCGTILPRPITLALSAPEFNQKLFPSLGEQTILTTIPQPPVEPEFSQTMNKLARANVMMRELFN